MYGVYMAKNFVFPDPNDRTPNEPIVMVSSAEILGLYNQVNTYDKIGRVTQEVQDWFTNEAVNKYNWHTATFTGNQCLLTMNLPKISYPS
jgi:hypothetical protein